MVTWPAYAKPALIEDLIKLYELYPGRSFYSIPVNTQPEIEYLQGQ